MSIELGTNYFGHTPIESPIAMLLTNFQKFKLIAYHEFNMFNQLFRG